MLWAVGDEVITCALSTRTPDPYGRHRHDDPCFEVRTILRFTKESTNHSESWAHVPGLLDSSLAPDYSLQAPPESLLQRKDAHFRKLVEYFRDREIWGQSMAHVMLEDVLKILDAYLFASAPSALVFWPPGKGSAKARRAFDMAAHVAIEHRRDNGMGRRRHLLIREIVEALNTGPVDGVLGTAAKLLCRF